MTVTIAAVIPTRNRAELAINAVRSLLDQDCPLEVFVSDNSSSPDALRDLWSNEPRVHYLRPGQELSMPEHWDWALRQAMQRSAASHFSVHYDRKVSKPQHWGGLAATAGRWPELLITFPVDFIAIDPPPLRLWQPPWTGKVYAIETACMAQLVAHGRINDTAQALPVLSNCVVPRAVLQSIVNRFGDICNSTGPDSAFASRFLALHDRFLHFDRATGIAYAAHRSAGLGYLRGKGGDFSDYLERWGERPWLEAAPIPGINLGHNMLFHEYQLARHASGDRLPPIDRAAYLNHLGAALRWIHDPELQAEMRRVIEQHGWRGVVEPHPTRSWRSSARETLQRILAGVFGIAPPHMCGFTFRHDAQALHYALKYPRRRTDNPEHLAAVAPMQVEPR